MLKNHRGLFLFRYHLPFPKSALADATQTVKSLLHKVSLTNDSLISSEVRKPLFRPGIGCSAQCHLRTLSSAEIRIRATSAKTKQHLQNRADGGTGSASPGPRASGAGDPQAG